MYMYVYIYIHSLYTHTIQCKPGFMGQLVGQGRKISSRMLEMVGPPAQSSKISEKPGVTGLGPFNGKPRGLKRSGISMDLT